jgi:hypothetical protein
MFRQQWRSICFVCALAAWVAGCGGSGGGSDSVTAPTTAATSVTLCGTLPGDSQVPPCAQVFGVKVTVLSLNTPACGTPCFTFTFLNQTVTGSAPTIYGFSGLGAGIYQITGQINATGLFSLKTNSMCCAPGGSGFGVVPNSIQSLTGPNPQLAGCSGLIYTVPTGTPLPVNFSYQFTTSNSIGGQGQPPSC